ncbi:hypothetical protein H4696_002398 [Amycolatopsis lexingtonensis]|uniref:Uncharacterized protein n=1 Tax=Amycolatopsis lexingtonensis TaxID=218822 RepID=A0ABR9HWI2_9PSEU|nr:DUF6461 domain-containing protein [Amycolatopsis lexingtonensis]MBE1495298.1 hypothetical protein [Amycolatopsis lexingtonensis]
MGENLAAAVAAAVPVVRAVLPPAPAAALGRLALEPPPRFPDWPEAEVVRSLRSVPSWVVERVHGAVELTLAALVIPAPPVTGELTPPQSGSFGFLSSDSEAEAVRETRLLAQFRPDLLALVADLTAAVAADEALAPLLTAEGDEAAIAAAHGGAYLSIALVTTAIAAREAGQPGIAAIVGTALGVAAGLLRAVPMPAGYAEAVREKERAEYRLPRSASTSVDVRDHVFALTEGAFPAFGDFAENGLVEAATGGVVIRTGVEAGHVGVSVRVLAEPPTEVETAGWEEVVDVGWRAEHGSASLAPSAGTSVTTPPWPGEYRVRVHAYGRDDPDAESYALWIWAAPAEPPRVHARADRLGHRLRGEPEPPLADRPEVRYRWIRQSRLTVAATVTVVTGLPAAEVVRGFGADPDRPEPLPELREAYGDPWLSVLDLGGVVLAIEENGYLGSHEEVLTAVSQGGRAASMFWNVNAVTRLSFARDGEVMASFEPGLGEPAADPEVVAALAGLDFEDYRDLDEKGLVAVERFTGRGLDAGDLEVIERAGVGYRIPGA